MLRKEFQSRFIKPLFELVANQMLFAEKFCEFLAGLQQLTRVKRLSRLLGDEVIVNDMCNAVFPREEGAELNRVVGQGELHPPILTQAV